MAPSDTKRLIKVYNCGLEWNQHAESVKRTYRLPEGKENDELNRQDLQKGLMLLDVLTGLVVELNQAVHSDSDGNRFNDDGLTRND